MDFYFAGVPASNLDGLPFGGGAGGAGGMGFFRGRAGPGFRMFFFAPVHTSVRPRMDSSLDS